jgi:hypothetical protein
MASLGLSNNSIMDPLRIAVLTAKYWGPQPRQLTVSFMRPRRPSYAHASSAT